MSIELQIRSSVLGAIAARECQASLLKGCFSQIGSKYIDHIDVAMTSITVTSAIDSVRFRIPLEVFVVSRQDILATPNGVPVGATTPAGTVISIMEMTANLAKITLQCIDADLSSLSAVFGSDLPAAKDAIVKVIGSPVNADFTAVLQQMGMPSVTQSKVEIIADIVTIRFQPMGSPKVHLPPGTDWGMFLDGASVGNLVLSKVPKSFTSQVSSLSMKAYWRPAGNSPHVDIDYKAKVPVPDPLSGNIDGVVGCDLSLTPTITPFLRATMTWSLHIDLGDWAPGFVENWVEDHIIESKVKEYMDPTKFGGVPISDHVFALDMPLRKDLLGSAKFEHSSIGASPEGMTIGGSVKLPPDPGTNILQLSVSPFGLPQCLFTCRQLARSGSGAPPKSVSIDEVTTFGSAWLYDSGAFCGFEVVSPGDWIIPYVTTPSGSDDLSIEIPSAIALNITDPVELIVRTSRGVRVVDLGAPPPAIVDANGRVSNVIIMYIPNCVFVDDHGINWAREGGMINQSVVNPPLELPEWAIYRHRGVEVQLVSLFDLEPGELIRFRSRDHAMDVVADHNGKALVPVLLPVTFNGEGASLIRVNQRSIAHHFTIQSVIFNDRTGLQGLKALQL